MSIEELVKHILKNYPEVRVSPRKNIEAIMYEHGKRETAIELLEFLGRDANGKAIG